MKQGTVYETMYSFSTVTMYHRGSSVSDCTNWYKCSVPLYWYCTWCGKWMDYIQADHSNISACGVTSADTTTDSGTVQSKLAVPATSVNNGTTV